MKIQQKLLISNQEVPSNLQGFHKKFIIHPKPQPVQCTQPSWQDDTAKAAKQTALFLLFDGVQLIVLPQFIACISLTSLSLGKINSWAACFWSFRRWGSSTLYLFTEIKLNTVPEYRKPWACQIYILLQSHHWSLGFKCKNPFICLFK